MSKKLTLTNIMNGIFNLSLHTQLTPAEFRFFWSLIMVANRLSPRFANPFNLTVAQAIDAGCGNSRQAVWQTQQRLSKISINGEHLVYILPGSRRHNHPANYCINYALLLKAKKRSSTEFDDHQRSSTEFDDHGKDRQQNLTILRDLRGGGGGPCGPSGHRSKQESCHSRDALDFTTIISQVDIAMVREAFRYKWGDIVPALPSDEECRQAIALAQYDVNGLCRSIGSITSVLRTPTTQAALNFALTHFANRKE